MIQEIEAVARDEPKATGKLYDRLMQKVRPVMAQRYFDTVTFVWMQGESDSKEHGAVCAEILLGLHAQLQADLGRDDIFFL